MDFKNYPHTQFYSDDKEEIDNTIGGFTTYPHTDFSGLDDGEIYELNDGVSTLIKAVTNPTASATTTTGDPNVNVTIDNEHLHFDFELPTSSDETMKYYILSYDGTSIKHNDEVLDFNTIKAKCLNTTDFVYLSYANRLYIPQYVSNSNIFFESSYIQNDIPQMHRIGINSSNVVTQINYTITKQSDLNTTNSRVTTLESTTGELAGAVEGVQRDIDDISNAIDDINESIDTIDTRIATDNQLGQFKTSQAYQINNDDGLLKAYSLSNEAYNTASDNAFISKGTLENRLASIQPSAFNIEELWTGGLKSGNTGQIAHNGHNIITIECRMSSSNSRVLLHLPLALITNVSGQSRNYAVTTEANYLVLYVVKTDSTITIYRTSGTSTECQITGVWGWM